MAVQSLDLAELAGRAEAAVRVERPTATVADVEQIVGGTSSLTYVATLQEAGVSPQRVIVKVAPPGIEPVRNRDVLRQARVLQMLGAVAVTGDHLRA